MIEGHKELKTKGEAVNALMDQLKTILEMKDVDEMRYKF
jgi:hypothetical protein